MIVALSGGQKVGLLVVAAIFITFALASSFLFPRSNPNFPGERRVRLFVAITVALVVAMLGAMFVLAREPEESAAHGSEPAQTEGEEPAPPPGETETGAEPAGDSAAGKQVFASAGCGACHTLGDAGSSGSVGPNLDDAQPDYDLVVERVTSGMGAMPSFENSLSLEEIQDVAAYVSQAAGSPR